VNTSLDVPVQILLKVNARRFAEGTVQNMFKNNIPDSGIPLLLNLRSVSIYLKGYFHICSVLKGLLLESSPFIFLACVDRDVPIPEYPYFGIGFSQNYIARSFYNYLSYGLMIR
jgi:hypothetical protein